MMTLLEPASLLNQMTEGVYATDTDRRIVYWNAAAERITGYSAEEVIGRQCRDNILMHETKDGKRLCGFNECPMYRAICTCQRLQVPMVVYARHKDGHRIPLHVSVAPYADETGAVVGGIEVFRDLSTSMFDYERARDISATFCRRRGPTTRASN